ncbi:MAG: hypothetical protein ACREOZ_04315, partial [Gloeomargaritales cyanobacterium]
IYTHRTRKELQKFLIKKTGWDESTFMMVDFNVLGNAMSSLTETERIARVKFMHNWWHHGRQQKLMGVETTSENGQCPLCLGADETTDHILRCPSEQGKTARRKAWLTVLKELKEEKTAPLILKAINESVASWTEGRTRTWRSEYTDINAQQVHKAAQAQSKIGWEQFMRGRVARQWRMAQMRYLNETGSPCKYTAERWAKKLIKLIWNYAMEIWHGRNQLIYGENEAANESRRRAKAVQAIHESFQKDKNNVSATHSQLFSIPIETRIEQSTAQMENWLESVKVAVRSEVQRREREIAGTADIRRFCNRRRAEGTEVRNDNTA